MCCIDAFQCRRPEMLIATNDCVNFQKIYCIFISRFCCLLLLLFLARFVRTWTHKTVFTRCVDTFSLASSMVEMKYRTHAHTNSERRRHTLNETVHMFNMRARDLFHGKSNVYMHWFGGNSWDRCKKDDFFLFILQYFKCYVEVMTPFFQLASPHYEGISCHFKR